MIGKNFFQKQLGKLRIKKRGHGYAVELSLESFGKKLDIAQDVLDAQVWNDIKRYMPMDTGTLIRETDILNQSTRGEVYLYPPDSDYGHYQYEGIKYVDPDYGVGAFYSPDYGYWSRPGIEKVPSNEPLFYGRESAEAHWDEVAYRDCSKKWVKVAKQAVKG